MELHELATRIREPLTDLAKLVNEAYKALIFLTEQVEQNQKAIEQLNRRVIALEREQRRNLPCR